MQRLGVGLVGLLTVLTGVSVAQGQPSNNLSETVRLELSVSSPLLTPDRPIWVRFLLHNDGDTPIDMPASDIGGVSLPLELVLGEPNAPVLELQFDDDPPLPIAPADDPPPLRETLTIAPHSTLGRTIDLQEVYKKVRYVGDYALTWQPLADVRPATVAFRVEPRKEAILVTDQGKVTFELFYEEAPLNVENFLELVRRGFYDGKTFHRIVPGFAAQGGCPEGDGTGQRPDGTTVPAEIHDAEFKMGTLAMATKAGDPDSASCQFFITLGPADALDGKYTVIGQASDEASMRTLQQFNTIRTDEGYRPMSTVVIRSLNLVPERDRVRARRLELRGRSGENLGAGRN